MPTVEELEAALAAERANATAASEAAKAKIKELNDEAKGHRLNGDSFRTQAERAAKEAADAKTALEAKASEVAAERARLENEAAEKVKAADTKATEAAAKAQERVVNADLKIAAKDAGAHDAADMLLLLDRSKIKLDDKGEITNAADLMAELKKAKPHLFGAASTSNPGNPPPKTQTGAKHVKDMTDEEFEVARRSSAWRK